MLSHNQRHLNQRKTKFQLLKSKMLTKLLIPLYLKKRRWTQIWLRKKRSLACSNVLIRPRSFKLACLLKLIFPKTQSVTFTHSRCSSDSDRIRTCRLLTLLNLPKPQTCTLRLKKMMKTLTKITKGARTLRSSGGWSRMPSPRRSQFWPKKNRLQKKLSRSATSKLWEL